MMNVIDILEELAELSHINSSVKTHLASLESMPDWKKTLSPQSYFATEDKVVCIEE